jgi:hypothetical protein
MPTTTVHATSATVHATSAGHAPVSRATYLRRRLVVLAVLLVVGFLLTVAIGRVGAQAELEDPVAGHVVVEPGQTLWDVAVATAPDGVDARQQLADLRELNGTDGEVEAWTAVLLPAR